LHEGLELLAVVARGATAAILGLSAAHVGRHFPRAPHTGRSQTEAADSPLELGPLAGIIAAGQPLHRPPAVKECPGLLLRPAEVVEDVSAALVERVFKMFERQIGGVAGVGDILLAPFHWSAACRRWSISARTSRPILAASKPHLVVARRGSLPGLPLRIRCFAVSLLARLPTGLSSLFTLLTFTLLTFTLLTFTLLTLTLLALSLLALSLLALSLLTLSLLTLSLLALASSRTTTSPGFTAPAAR